MSVEKYKTICCQSDWYVKSRANFRCNKCEEDVTLEIMLMYNAMEKKLNNN